MSISILPYDNINNWSDLEVWEAGLCIHSSQEWRRVAVFRAAPHQSSHCVHIWGVFSQSSLARWVFFRQFICLSLCDNRLKVWTFGRRYVILSYESKELNDYSGVCDHGSLLVDVLLWWILLVGSIDLVEVACVEERPSKPRTILYWLDFSIKARHEIHQVAALQTSSRCCWFIRMFKWLLRLAGLNPITGVLHRCKSCWCVDHGQ